MRKRILCFALLIVASRGFCASDTAPKQEGLPPWVEAAYSGYLAMKTLYRSFMTVSFRDAPAGGAITGLYNDADRNGRPTSFEVRVKAAKTGAYMIFFAYRKCVPTDPTKLVERIIRLDGQKIAAYYTCVQDKSAPGTVELYLPQTRAGAKYAVAEFHRKPHVMVELEGLRIPFDTAGFAQVWANESGDAL